LKESRHKKQKIEFQNDSEQEKTSTKDYTSSKSEQSLKERAKVDVTGKEASNSTLELVNTPMASKKVILFHNNAHVAVTLMTGVPSNVTFESLAQHPNKQHNFLTVTENKIER
jgi:hypothetical protein